LPVSHCDQVDAATPSFDAAVFTDSPLASRRRTRFCAKHRAVVLLIASVSAEDLICSKNALHAEFLDADTTRHGSPDQGENSLLARSAVNS